MSGFSARYYDGRSSAGREVRIRMLEGGRLHVTGDGVDRVLARGEVRVSARLGSTPRRLHFPDGAHCESSDHDAVDAAFRRGGVLHALERRWSLAAAAAGVTLAFLWLSFEYVLPALARHAAHAVPPAMEARLGAESLEALDRHLLGPSRLTEVDRERVRASFARIAQDLGMEPGVRLELRRAEDLGPNAFALPAGIVIVTDELVELAERDEELMGVIAHELGHVHHRHILRSVLQNSVAALLVAVLLGDVTSVAGLAASIPAFLVEQRYSREFELEADAFALRWMRTSGVDPAHLAAMLRRLGEVGGADLDEGLASYLSTHPSTARRIEALEGSESD